MLATAATTAIVATTAPIVSGSVGCTPNSNDVTSRVRPKAPASPAATPMPASTRPCFSTWPMTLPRSAPSAMRMPISRRRSVTM